MDRFEAQVSALEEALERRLTLRERYLLQLALRFEDTASDAAATERHEQEPAERESRPRRRKAAVR